MEESTMRASQIIAELQALVAEHGDLECYFADGRDYAWALYCVSMEEDTGWEDAPDGKAFYFS